MSQHDPRVDTYIASAAEFARPLLERARELVHTCGKDIEETTKWGMPTFLYCGRIIAGMAAFKQHAALSFWQHQEVMGEGVKLDGMGSFGKMTTLKDLPSRTRLQPLMRKAMALIDAAASGAGPRSQRSTKPAPDVPADLKAALAANRKAEAAFDRFPPSHRREYIEWLLEAKREETRARRLEQAIAWIAEGKSRNWKYAKRG